MKLCGVREGELRGLLGHGAADFCDAVTDIDHGSLPAGVEITASVLIDDPAALAPDGDWVGFAKISRKQGGVGRHDSRQIVTEAELAGGKYCFTYRAVAKRCCAPT